MTNGLYNGWQTVCAQSYFPEVVQQANVQKQNSHPQSCFPGKHFIFFKQRIIMNALGITNIESQGVCLLLGTGFLFNSSYSLFFWYCNINSLGKKALW